MFDELYQDETDAVARAEIETPTPAVRRKPGLLTGAATALASGSTQGLLETGRVGLGVLSEFGKAAAFAQGGDKAKTIDQMFTEESEAGQHMGRLARSFDPSPETSSTAAQLIHGVSRMATKAIGYIATTGPAAPLLMGADEGVTEAMKLSDKGVDPATAAKAGVARGVSTAIGMALPVAAATKLGTSGLVVAGGPALNMADKSTIRDILDAAGHDHLLAEYDPYNLADNVVATVPGALFGTAKHLMHGSRADVPAAAVLPPPDDLVDAARFQSVIDHDMALVRGDDIDAVVAHVQGRDEAARRINDSETLMDTAERDIGSAGADPVTPGANDLVDLDGRRIDGPGADPLASPRESLGPEGTTGAAEEAVAPRLTERAGEASIAAPAPDAQAGRPPAQDSGATAASVASNPSPMHPDVERAHRAIEQRGDFEMELEDGSRVSARQFMEESQQAVKHAETEGRAFRAAVECAIGGGV